MNATRPFYPHESDDRIMRKKDRAEIGNWTDDLEYINEELDLLLDMEDCMLNRSEHYQHLHTLRRENQLRLSVLYRYEGNMRKSIECDTMECDAFYLHNHEKNRNLYVDHLKKYRDVKRKVLSKILLKAKR